MRRDNVYFDRLHSTLEYQNPSVHSKMGTCLQLQQKRIPCGQVITNIVEHASHALSSLLPCLL